MYDPGSAFKTCSKMEEFFGYAVCDKENDSIQLKVYCTDLLPMHTGDLNAIVAKANIANNQYKGEVAESNYILCTYRDDSSNHTAFPPDIRKGEQVRIYKLGDSEQYFWAPCARTEGNRRTETHRIAISDTLDNDTVLDDDNAYYLEMDTRRSHSITLCTNKADGEAYKYQLKIDADNHMVVIGDDVGNDILINSDTQSITLQTKSGATIQVTQNDMNMTCKGDVTMYIKGNVNQMIEGNVTLDCKGSVSISSRGKISLSSDTGIDLKAPSVNVSKGSWGGRFPGDMGG